MKQFLEYLKRNRIQLFLLSVMVTYFVGVSITGTNSNCVIGNWLNNRKPNAEMSSEGSAFNLYQSGMTFSFLDGTTLNVAELNGKPTAINYWATWCGPCRKELPGFNKVAESMAGEIQIIGISLDQGSDAVQKFLQTNPLAYPVSHAETRLMKDTGDVNSIPTTLFFDRDGNYRGKHVGFLSQQQLQNKLKNL